MKAILQIGFFVLAITRLAVSADAGPLEDGLAAGERGDYAAALKYWRPLAEQGNAKLQFTIGLIYYNGKGVPQDYAEAVAWYRKAAEQGHAEAQHNLGLMYEKGLGVPQDFVLAHVWFDLAVAHVHEEAKQDRDRIASLMAPDQIAAAQTNLGYMYDIGRGVPQDYAEAAKWYRIAAEQGDASAQSNLGIMYRGGLGVPQDDAQAVKWFRMAAEQGIAQAQYNLGNRYANGQGVSLDLVQALMWFALAAEQGSEKAKENREIAASKMTPDQIAEAQRMARERMSQTLNGEARGTDPKEVLRQAKTHSNSQLDAGPKVPGERIGHMFSNMMFGEYCKTAYIQISKASGSGPAAMALGEESCGISGAGNETVADAEAEALEKCKSATIGCRIIFTSGYAPVSGDQTGSAEWTAACARKYRSFDPRTGLYTAHSGNKRRCRLP